MPELYTIMSIATVPIVVAFIIVNYVIKSQNTNDDVYGVVTWFMIFMMDIFVMTGWFPVINKWVNGEPQPNLTHDEQPTQADYNHIPQIRDGGKPVYRQNTTSIKMDYIRMFNRTLIDQRRANLEVNMTENFWLKKYDGMEESRWSRIGGKGREAFLDLIERGMRFGAYKKIGGQNKSVPADWQKIRMLEQGTPLP